MQAHDPAWLEIPAVVSVIGPSLGLAYMVYAAEFFRLTYLLIKCTHLASVVVWMGVMIFIPAVMESLRSLQDEARLGAARLVRTWYRGVGSVAMIGTWIFGITLMVMGGWTFSSWMVAKIAVVLALSALHGFISGQFRQLATDSSFELGGWPTVVTICELLALLLVLALVVLKPF